jgi:hypothetical protein
LATLGAPWVAQRVWPMPMAPLIGSWLTNSDSAESLPSARRRSSVPS